MSSWVDITVIHSVLSGLLVTVVAAWAFYGINRLQQGWLLSQVQGALDRAAERGLTLSPLGLRARLVARPTEGAAAPRIEWRTGVLGPRTLLWSAQGARRLPLLRTAAELDEALDGP